MQEISKIDEGNGNVPLVFIHGFPFDKSSWQPQIDYFKNSHRIIAYDIRGFGKSASGNEEFGMSLFADDLISLLDSLQIDKAIICGLSMGGYIALNAISRFPERFAGLILCDTQCVADNEEGRAKRYETIKHIEQNGVNEFVDTFIKNLFSESVSENWKQKIRQVMVSTDQDTVTKTLKALAERAETCCELKNINIPVLIICGEDDKITPVEKSKFMHEQIEESVLKIIPRAGHLSNVEQPDEFNKALKDFLSTRF